MKNIDPFDLELSLNNAVLLQAAQHAEAKASLAHSTSEAALPIKPTSAEESPRQPQLLHRKPAPLESSYILGAATCNLSPDEPHARKRDPEKGQASQPEPWTPEGSPPPSAIKGPPLYPDLQVAFR